MILLVLFGSGFAGFAEDGTMAGKTTKRFMTGAAISPNGIMMPRSSISIPCKG
jgi:hypothetical protein